MPTYYVSTTGNDANDGSAIDDAHAWLTLTKAVNTAVAGDTIRIKAGTYAENAGGTGRWDRFKNNASDITFMADSGATDVHVTGASDATNNTLMSSTVGNPAHYVFTHISFECRAVTNAHAFRIAVGSNITFNNCAFVAATTGASSAAMDINPSGAGVSNITFNTCTFTQTGAAANFAARCTASTGIPVDSVTYTSCTFSNTGATGTNYGLLLGNGTQAPTNITITNGSSTVSTGGIALGITKVATLGVTSFTATATTNHGILVNTGSSAITLTTCTSSSTGTYALYITGSQATVTVSGGTYTCTSATTPAIYVFPNATTQTGISFGGASLIARGKYGGLEIDGASGATDVTITAGLFLGTLHMGLRVGNDGTGAGTVTGSATNCFVQSDQSHGAEIGGGTSSYAFSNMTIVGGYDPTGAGLGLGLVLKECTGATVTNCILDGGSDAVLYFKAAVNCSVTGCILTGSKAPLLQVLKNNITLNKCQNVTFTGNYLIAMGTASLFNWGTTAADDAGGGNCDNNRYLVLGSATWGTVLGNAVSSLATLRSNWGTGSYSTTNDQRSALFGAIGFPRRFRN